MPTYDKYMLCVLCTFAIQNKFSSVNRIARGRSRYSKHKRTPFAYWSFVLHVQVLDG